MPAEALKDPARHLKPFGKRAVYAFVIKNAWRSDPFHNTIVTFEKMKTVTVIYHSMTGGSLQMATAFVRGAAREPEVKVILLHASEATLDDVLACDGLVFATPENLGSMSGMLKDFFDRCYYPALDKLNGRPYQSLICAGSDGHGAARQIERIAIGWRLRAAAPPLILLTHAQTPEAILKAKTIAPDKLDECADLGEGFATALAMGVF